MAKTKQWTVQTSTGQHAITYHYGMKAAVEIDGQRIPLKDFPDRKSKFIGMLQELPIKLDERQLLLVINGNSLDLVSDGYFIDSGQPYVPIEKLPAWVYVFLVLNAALFLFLGAIPAVCSILGITYTLRVAMKPYMGTGAKIAACVGIWLGMLAIIFGVSFLFMMISPY